jgi:hypothetical protein
LGPPATDGRSCPDRCILHRFANGRFTLPELTVVEMQDRVRGKLRDMGFPGFLAGFFTRKIPKLERWK